MFREAGGIQAAPGFDSHPHTSQTLLCHRCVVHLSGCAIRTRPTSAPGRPRLTGIRWDACTHTPQGARNHHATGRRGFPARGGGHCRTGFCETKVSSICLRWRSSFTAYNGGNSWRLLCRQRVICGRKTLTDISLSYTMSKQ